MPQNSFFVQKYEDYQIAFLLLNKVFHIQKKLPNQVFKTPFSGFLFQDFDWTLTKDFWDTFLSPLGNVFKDNYILTAVLDPDPIHYFHHNFGYYNMIKFPSNSTANEYWKNLEAGPENSPADAILYNSEIIVWIPPSANWAIWAERNHEICILAFASESVQKLASPIAKNWKLPNNVINSSILKKSSHEFLRLFSKNYSKSAG